MKSQEMIFVDHYTFEKALKMDFMGHENFKNSNTTDFMTHEKVGTCAQLFNGS